jgi:subtilisin family serine protease
MAKNGRAGDALVISGVASFVGATLATIGLMLLAPMLSRVAYQFGPAEYFALYLLAFCTLGGIASNNQAKAAFASCLGIAIAMIGLDPNSGMPRLTGGNLHLYDGVDFLVAIVGLFAVSEVFFFIESHGKSGALGVKLDKVTHPLARDLEHALDHGALVRVGLHRRGAARRGRKRWAVLPDLCDREKSIAGDKGGFGTGVAKGIAAPEVGNNAAAGGALVPMLTLGVPGSGTTAVLLAVLVTLNITPGPTLFTERARCGLGPDRLAADRQLRAAGDERAYGAHLRAGARRAARDPDAGGHDDLVRGDFLAHRQLFRPAAGHRLRRAGLCLAKTRHSHRAGDPGHPAGQARWRNSCATRWCCRMATGPTCSPRASPSA